MPVVSILIGLGAGVVSALLFASAATGTLIGIFMLFLLSPLPVAIAGLGWGWIVGSIAAVSAVVALAIIGSPAAGIVHLLTIGLPTAVLSYLLLLNRDVADGPGSSFTQWYPIGRVLGFAAAWAGVLAVLSLMTVAGDYDELRARMKQNAQILVDIVMGSQKDASPQERTQAIERTGELMALLYATSVSTSWMLLSTFNIWLGGRVTKASGRLTRPWPDLALVRMPGFAVLGLAGAVLAGTLLSSLGLPFAAVVASGFAASCIFVAMLVGLAVLHYHSRQWALRPLALGATYASLLFVFPWAHFAAAALAIAEPMLPVRRPPEDTPPPQPETLDT